MIKNPNDIVDKLVEEVAAVYGERLLSVIMYGSAVTHEFRPGKSDVNITLVLTDTSIATIEEGLPVLSRWLRRGIASPLFMTPEYIESSLDAYPIEFLDMKYSYRVLAGDDYLAKVNLKKRDLRLQCERELRGMVIHLKKGFVNYAEKPKHLYEILLVATRTLLPLFRAILVLFERKIPNSKAEIIADVEDLFGFGVSALSVIFNNSQSKKNEICNLYRQFTGIVENILEKIDQLSEDQSKTQAIPSTSNS